MPVIVKMAPISAKLRYAGMCAVLVNRITVVIVPAPVVIGIPIGMIAVEMMVESDNSGVVADFCSAFNMLKPVKTNNNPPAIRKAGTLISKKLSMPMPINMETTIVKKAVSVAVRQIWCCSTLLSR